LGQKIAGKFVSLARRDIVAAGRYLLESTTAIFLVSGVRCQEFNDLGIKGLRNSRIGEFKRQITKNT